MGIFTDEPAVDNDEDEANDDGSEEDESIDEEDDVDDIEMVRTMGVVNGGGENQALGLRNMLMFMKKTNEWMWLSWVLKMYTQQA